MSPTSKLRYLGLTLAAGTLSAGMASADIQHLDDVIITFSLCVGNDCNNGESFGFDTMRLKENNLRIHFDDTSVSASFPRNDWRIVANDTSNGGTNHWSVEDSTAGRSPFRIEAGASANALVIEADSDIGIGTLNPVVELHVVDGDSPTLRLEQDGSSGFTPQTFDLVSNEANFFIRDVTNGSQLPFRIKPGADTDALFIDANNEIGIGTDSPGADLHIRAGGSAFSANAGTHVLIQNSANTGDAARLSIIGGATGSSQIALGDTTNEFAARIRYEHNTDSMDFFVGASQVLELVNEPAGNVITTPLSGAVLTTAGVWQDASSRALKQNINTLSLEDAVETLQGLEPVTYNYKVEPNELTVGFIAEDVPDMVATASRASLSSLDIVAVLTRVVQDQNVTMAGQADVIADLQARLELLETQQAD